MSAAEVAQATLLEHCSERQQGKLPTAFTVVVGSREYIISAYGPHHALVKAPYFAATVGTRRVILPAADCMLAAKLLLEADEQHFVSAATVCGMVWLD